MEKRWPCQPTGALLGHPHIQPSWCSASASSQTPWTTVTDSCSERTNSFRLVVGEVKLAPEALQTLQFISGVLALKAAGRYWLHA